ncbi:hypothetical protein BGZ65_010530, partial [Modicella reniformis]
QNHIGHGQSVVGMRALAELLKINKFLREINLSYNLLSSCAVQELMKGVAVNSTLESIIFTNCCITTEGAIAIAEILPSTIGLQNLGLTENPDIAVEGYWALATNLAKNRSMKGIQLDYNSEDRHVLYESIQCSLTKNFLWQQAVYTATCRILTLSRIVLLGRPADQKMAQPQLLQRQQSGGGAWNLLKKVRLGRSGSASSMASILTLGRSRRISVEPASSPSNSADGSAEVQSLAQKNCRRVNLPYSPPSQTEHLFNHQQQQLMDQENPLQGPPYQHRSRLSSSSMLLQAPEGQPSTPSGSRTTTTTIPEYNAHKMMTSLANMPHEIFESICAYLDPGQDMTIAQIRSTIQMAGNKSTLSESHTKAAMLEHVFRSRYIPPVGMRYSIKDANERI